MSETEGLRVVCASFQGEHPPPDHQVYIVAVSWDQFQAALVAGILTGAKGIRTIGIWRPLRHCVYRLGWTWINPTLAELGESWEALEVEATVAHEAAMILTQQQEGPWYHQGVRAWGGVQAVLPPLLVECPGLDYSTRAPDAASATNGVSAN